MDVVRKITTKIMGLTPKAIREAIEAAEGDRVLLYSAAGVAVKVEEGDGQFGTYKYFIGEFNAISHVTGEEFLSPKIFLQPPFDSMLQSAVLKTGDKAGVEFAVNVVAKEADTQIGYEYEALPATEMAVSDTIGRLMASALKKIPTNLKPKKKE